MHPRFASKPIVLLALAACLIAPFTVHALLEPSSVTQDTYGVVHAVGELTFDTVGIERAGLTLSAHHALPTDSRGAFLFNLFTTDASFNIVAADDVVRMRPGGEWPMVGAPIVLTGPGGADLVLESLIMIEDQAAAPEGAFALWQDGPGGRRAFGLHEMTFTLYRDEGALVIAAKVSVAEPLAEELGLPSISGAIIGHLWMTARLQLAQTVIVGPDGQAEAAVLPPFDAGPGASGDFPTAGPDVIVGSVTSVQQYGRIGPIGEGTLGLAIGTVSCNKGDVPLNWYQLPSVHHPVIFQHLYRLETVDGSQRFEQIGHSWMKHGFSALQQNVCDFGCQSSGSSSLLGVGCSDPYSSSLNANQCGLGPPSAVQPYTGEMTEGGELGEGGGCVFNYPSRNHIDHAHNAISHRIQVADADLMRDAEFFAEAIYITAHEYMAGNGNQNNNASYREFDVFGPDKEGDFLFFPASSTMREQPAINAWSSASQTLIEPEPMVDGRAFLAYEVTDLGDGLWHYEYGLFNLNLDRSIGSFSVPIGAGVTITNVGFHAPLNHAPEPGADNYSNDVWEATISPFDITWFTESLDQNEFANAVRHGTLYNFRFDADAAPETVEATIGLFKTEDFIMAETSGPTAIAPVIVGGVAGTSFSSRAFGGYIDPRMESNNGIDVNLGIDEITVRFSEEVRNIGGGALTSDAFSVVETGDLTPPIVSSISTDDNQTVTVTMERAITIQEWTTLRASVENLAGIPIFSPGDLGPDVDEPDRIDVAYLPLDVDQNERVDSLDVLVARQILLGVGTPAIGVPEDYVDTDRSGVITPLDFLRFRQLLLGVGFATQPWVGTFVNHPRP